MSDSRRCPQCQAPLPDDAPSGVCPACLMGMGLAGGSAFDAGMTGQDEPEATSASLGHWVAPTTEELSHRLPQLEVLEILGRGGMGAVYKARQIALDRLVAVKVLPPAVGRDAAFSERFVREAKALARLQHPNIVNVFDFGRAGEMCYLIMEYVDGVNLRRAIQARSLTPAQALGVVPQICDALQYAHDEGVVHRDIKPENILLDSKGRVKIADFGLAKLLRRSTPELALTATHQIMGTLHYMAPEQLENPLGVDHRADIYSLGVVFYELLTGQLPLGRFALPSERAQVDQRLDDVVLKTLEREPDRRYQQASEVKTHVQTISSGPAPTAASAPRGQVSFRPASPRRFWPLVLLIGAAVLALTPCSCVPSVALLLEPNGEKNAAIGFAISFTTLLVGAATIAASLYVAKIKAMNGVGDNGTPSRSPGAQAKPPVAAYPQGKPLPNVQPVQATSNAFAGGDVDSHAAERAVRWPARLLWLAGALAFLSYLIGGAFFIIHSYVLPGEFNDADSALLYAALAIAGVVASSVVMHGASRLRWRTSPGWIVAGAVLALFVQPFPPAWLIGVIAGVWTLLVLRKTSVKLDMARGMTDDDEWRARRSSRRTRLAATAASLALVTGACLAQFGHTLVPPEVGAVLTYEATPLAGEELRGEELRQAVLARVNPAGKTEARVTFFEDISTTPDRLDITIDVFGREAAKANRIEERLAAAGRIELRAMAQSTADAEVAAAAQALPTYRYREESAGETDAARSKAKWITVGPRAMPSFLDVFGKIHTHLVHRLSASGQLEALVLNDDFHVGRADIARVEMESRGVKLSFNSRGAEKMRRFTSQPQYAASVFDHEIRRLAVIVDDQIYMLLPMGQIVTDQLVLSDHHHTEDDARGVFAILKTGPLPARLTQTSRRDLE